MKILCVSDEKDPLVYSSQISKRFQEIELVIGCGDLSLNYYEFIVSSLNKTLLFVFGNHNLKRLKYFKKDFHDDGFTFDNMVTYDKYHFGSTYIGDKLTKVKGLLIMGLGGSRKYNRGPNQYTEFSMFTKILKLLPKLLWNKIFHKRYLDILVTHAPPFGIHDRKDLCHKGFKVFLWFMRKFSPKYLIHGHVHIYDLNKKRVDNYYNTTVVNAFGHIVLDIEVE